MNAEQRPIRGAAAVTTAKQDPDQRTALATDGGVPGGRDTRRRDRVGVAAHEAELHVEEVARITAAMASGSFPIEVDLLDHVGDLVAAASRWMVLAEFEAAA